jgi:hypothetical protein
VLELVLSAAEAQRLPVAAHRLDVTVNELLLGCLAVACRDTGETAVVVGNTVHGRSVSLDGATCSGSVGWFTYNVPLVLAVDVDADDELVGRCARASRTIPRGGVGNQILLYDRTVDPDASAAVARVRDACQLTVNFMNGLDGPDDPRRRWRLVSEPYRRQEALPRTTFVRLLCADGANGALRFTWAFSPRYHAESHVERLAGSFEAAVRRLGVDGGGSR